MKKLLLVFIVICLIVFVYTWRLYLKESYNTTSSLSNVLISDPSGNLTTTSSLTLNNVASSGNVTVSGQTNIAGNVAASGNVLINGDLNVRGKIRQNGFEVNNILPPGSIIMWRTTTPPAGWALCDGSSQNVGGVQVNVPDLRGRFVLGAGQGHNLTERTVGTTGGSETHTLTESEMPLHRHSGGIINGTFSGTTNESGKHTHTVGGIRIRGNESGSNDYTLASEGGRDYSPGTSEAGAHTHTFSGNFQSDPFTTNSTGSGQPHNNMPPYYVLTFIIKL